MNDNRHKNKLTKKEIDMIIREGEGATIEFKETYTPKIAETITAFANGRGGSIIFGVTDDGRITGCELTNKQKAEITGLARNCSPCIDVSVSQAGKTAVVTVPEGKEKPYYCSGGYYRRLDAVTQKMNAAEIKDMYRENIGVSFEELVNGKVTIKDISVDKIREFITEAGVRLRVARSNMLEFLQSLNLADGPKIKNAAVLMFAKDVGKFIPQSQISLLLFKDHDKVEFIDRKQIRACLFDQFKEAMAFSEKHLNRRSKIVGVNRIDTYELPIEAVREAVVNAIIHRDYSVAGTDITVEIYPDTFEVSNPGGLPAGILPEELGKKSIRRNELLADMFFRLDKIEKTGTGIRRIKEAVRKAGLKEPGFESTGFFTVKFQLPKEFEGSGAGVASGAGNADGTGTTPGFGYIDGTGDSITPGEKVVRKGGKKRWYVKGGMKKFGEKFGEKLLVTAWLMKEDKYISIPVIAEKLKISTRAVEKYIVKLRQKRIIERVGGAKGGHWKVNI